VSKAGAAERADASTARVRRLGAGRRGRVAGLGRRDREEPGEHVVAGVVADGIEEALGVKAQSQSQS